MDKAANVKTRMKAKVIIMMTAMTALLPLSALSFNAPKPINAQDYFQLNGTDKQDSRLPSDSVLKKEPSGPELRPPISPAEAARGGQEPATGRGVKRRGTGSGASTMDGDDTASGASGAPSPGTARGGTKDNRKAARQSSTLPPASSGKNGKNLRGLKNRKAPTGGLSAPSGISSGQNPAEADADRNGSGAGTTSKNGSSARGTVKNGGSAAGGAVQNGSGARGTVGNGVSGVGGTVKNGARTGDPADGQQSVTPVRELTVTQSLNEGLLRSPRVAAVRLQLEITKALYAAATQMPNPALIQESAPIAEQSQRFGSQAIIEPPWKIAFRLLAAKRQVREMKSEILRTLWLFRNDVRRAYTETVVAQQAFETLAELADLSKRLMDVSQQRFQAGDVPELDLMKARLAAAQADVDKQQGLRRTMRARQQLNVVMGRNVEQPIAVTKLPLFQLHAEKSELLPDFDLQVPPMRDFIDLAMSNRLELKIISQQVAVAKAQLLNAYGSIIPNPQINSGHSYAGNPATGPGLNGYFIGVNMELPVFTTSQGDIARLRATIKQHQSQYKSQENLIVGEVSSAYNNLLNARERIQVYQTHVLAESQEVARLARLSYEVGQSDITSTLAAQQANIQVRSQYLDAVTAYQQAFTDLEQAVGEPLQ